MDTSRPTNSPSEICLPPSPGRIFRVIAGLAEWNAEELAWLKQNPGVIAYQDQLQATLESVHADLDEQRDDANHVYQTNDPFIKSCRDK